jgi:HKD family nuclease
MHLTEEPYIRLTRKRGNCQSPCGGSSSPILSGSFASKTDEEREEECPKIAWGIVCIFLYNLCWDDKQSDYVPQYTSDELIEQYYLERKNLYMNSHNGLKYADVSSLKKELDFIIGHISQEREDWEQSIPLKGYDVLYSYGKRFVDYYFCYLEMRKTMIEKACLDEDSPQIKLIIQEGIKDPQSISKFDEIESSVITCFNEAKYSINLCMAWFTNKSILVKLLERKEQGVKIRIIIDENFTNKQYGVDLSGFESKAMKGQNGGTMHSKFCVIDNNTTILGSYNFTKRAEVSNDENITIRRNDTDFASDYSKQFDKMWERIK